MRKAILILALLFAVSSVATAQLKFLEKVKTFLEVRQLNGLDTNYIGVHDRKWTVLANTYLSEMDFDMRSHIVDIAEGEAQKGRSIIDMRSKTHKQVSLGLYYLGYGLSYSLNLGKGFKKDWSFTMYSSRLGGEFRYHTTRNFKGSFTTPSGEHLSMADGVAKMENLILNAYYVFSPNKFSYSAAMSNFAIQKKSAGSFLGGLSLHQTRLRSYEPWFSYTLGRVNRLKFQQFAVGAGYAYNWVVAPRLVLHFSEIPMLLVTTAATTRMKASEEDDGWDTMQKQGYKDLFGKKTHVSYSHMFRTAASYEISDRVSVGATFFYNYFRVGKHSSYYVSTEDWNGRFYVAFRF
ncbi:MAG: DUF4421 family protein [Bacteroidales bacterium]|nr:DUF4421 family protein [Bacteroidales bacterium]